MSLQKPVTCLLAIWMLASSGCAGASWLAVAELPDEVPLSEGDAGDATAAQVRAATGGPLSQRSLRPQGVTRHISSDDPEQSAFDPGLDPLQSLDPAQATALTRELERTSAELPPLQRQLLPQLAAALSEPLVAPVAMRTPDASPAAGVDQPPLNALRRPASQANAAGQRPPVNSGGFRPAPAYQLAAADPARTDAVERVRPAVPELAAHKTDVPSPWAATAPESAAPETLSPGQWKATLADAIGQLEQELAGDMDEEQRVRWETSLRLLYVVDNQRDKAVAAIPQLGDDEQSYWKHQLYGLAISLDGEDRHARSRRAALALREVRQATDHLANISALDVRNLAFCEQVDSYGRYREFKPYAFDAGQEVLLYVEIENFTAVPAGDRYETELEGEYTILSATGARVASMGLPLDKQTCNNRRRDYFIAYRLFLPTEIDPGEYTLVLTVEDVKGRKSNQGSLEFRIR